MRMDHDIFRTPHPVELTIVDQPTPSSYANYPEGQGLGESMPMWRVQTEGYITDPGQLIGVVSRDAGFLDSPDVEWISGGVNSKGPNAVALGRHGNFFHWGFAVSPTFLTDEAKDVFVNALHYIARFDGHAPIARKAAGTMMRSSVSGIIDGLSEEGYARTVATYQDFQKADQERKAAIQARIDAGEAVSELERQMLTYPPTQIPSRLRDVERFLGKDKIAALGNDPDRIAAYLRKSMPYLYPEGWYSLVVDEELMALGTANSDMAMLDQAIALLASESTAGVGQALLERYTAESFGSAAEWNTWLAKHRDQLFFTEAGGYKWLVNTVTPPKAAGLRSSKARATKEKQPGPVATPREPLAAEATVVPSASGGFTLAVEVDIFPGWHAYENVPPGSAYTPLEIQLELPDGVQRVGEWTKPQGHLSPESPGLTVYEGRIKFECSLNAPDLATAKQTACQLRYQVCDANMCLQPSSERLAVTSP
jgi:hypothetical protein